MKTAEDFHKERQVYDVVAIRRIQADVLRWVVSNGVGEHEWEMFCAKLDELDELEKSS